MDREAKKPSNEKSQNEIEHLQTTERKVVWARLVTLFAGLASSIWLIYLLFEARGFLMALVAFVALGCIYKFGLSPLFAVSASVLCFNFKAVGLWLPILSYVVALLLLFVDWKRDNLRRRASLSPSDNG